MYVLLAGIHQRHMQLHSMRSHLMPLVQLCDIPAGELISPIHVAAYHGHEHLIGTLVDLGASPDSRVGTDDGCGACVVCSQQQLQLLNNTTDATFRINSLDDIHQTVFAYCYYEAVITRS